MENIEENDPIDYKKDVENMKQKPKLNEAEFGMLLKLHDKDFLAKMKESFEKTPPIQGVEGCVDVDSFIDRKKGGEQ